MRYLRNATDLWHGRAEKLVAPLAYQPVWFEKPTAQA